MIEPIFGTAALAQRLELAEALGGVACADAQQVLEIAGGYAIFAGAVSPLTQAIGVGMGTAVSEADIERIETFFCERGANPNIHLCPLADPALAKLLGKRGYRPVEFNNMLVRAPATDVSEYEAPRDVVVRVTDAAEVLNWANTVMRGFLERDELTETEIEFARTTAADMSILRLVAEIDGHVAGAAAFANRNGVALCFGDSTLKAFRRRGVHANLVKARLRIAAEAGCDWIAATTLPGSVSQRNYERCGFRVVYTKMAMLREMLAPSLPGEQDSAG